MKDLFAFVVVTLLSIAAFIGAAPALRRAIDQPFENSAAAMASLVTDSAVEYIRTYYGAVLSATAGGTIAQITPAMLQATGKLDPAFTDGNYFGQTHRVLVRRLSGNQLQAAVATCGAAMPEDVLFRLAPLAGKHAGLVSSTDPATIRGAVAGWTVLASAFGGVAGCAIVPGSLVNIVFFDDGAVLSPYMSRLPMPEFGTEPNTMRTNQYMGGNTIEDVMDIRLSNGQWLSTALSEIDLVQDGAVLAKPSCVHGVPRIWMASGVFSGNGTGHPLVGVQPWAEDNPADGSTWIVHVPIWTTNAAGTGTESAGSGPHGLAMAVRKCQQI
ncbi:shufflon system plasmid conjugative transfer pilus tip adhesin PilV [Azospirillum argentinense]